MQITKNLIALPTIVAAIFILSTSAVLASGGGHAPAGTSLSNGEKIFNEGVGDVPACTTCHGPKGLGNDDMGTPRLAGQGFSYIAKQLEDFAADRRTDTTMFVMNNNAKGMTPQQRRDVAAFLSSRRESIAPSELTPEQGGNAHLGKAIVEAGIIEKGVSACRACHGYNGRGVPPVYPTIGGQRFSYLVKQLTQWQASTRTNDPHAQMQAVAKNLSADDIRNVAAYLTSASVRSLGNTRTPDQMHFDH